MSINHSPSHDPENYLRKDNLKGMKSLGDLFNMEDKHSFPGKNNRTTTYNRRVSECLDHGVTPSQWEW